MEIENSQQWFILSTSQGSRISRVKLNTLENDELAVIMNQLESQISLRLLKIRVAGRQ